MKTLTKLFVSVSILLFSESVNSQTRFQNVIGGSSYYTAGYGIVKTVDDGYALTGELNLPGASKDVYVVKLDSANIIQWTRTFGDSLYDIGLGIIQTSDGGYAISGRSTTTNVLGLGLTDGYIVKLSSAGVVQWNRALGGYEMDEFRSIVQTPDGGLVAAGYSSTFCFGIGNSDVYVVKLDISGNIQWTRNVGGSGSDFGSKIVQTIDGGFVIAGSTTSYGQGNSDVYCVKLNSSGVLQWTTTVGGSQWDSGASIIQTADGGFIIAGQTTSFGSGMEDFYVVKIDGNGNLSWTRTIGGSGTDQALDIIQTSTGDYVIAGWTNSYGAGNYDFYAVKLNNNGNLMWTRTIGGAGFEKAYSLTIDSDGGYVITGSSSSFNWGSGAMYIVKLDTNGNTCANHGTGGVVGSGGVSSSGGSTGTGGNTATGGVSGTGGGTLNLCFTTGIIEVNNLSEELKVFPNPSSGIFKVNTLKLPYSKYSLHVWNILGEQIFNKEDFGAEEETIIDLSSQPKGIYFIKAYDSRNQFIQKLIVE